MQLAGVYLVPRVPSIASHRLARMLAVHCKLCRPVHCTAVDSSAGPPPCTCVRHTGRAPLPRGLQLLLATAASFTDVECAHQGIYAASALNQLQQCHHAVVVGHSCAGDNKPCAVPRRAAMLLAGIHACYGHPSANAAGSLTTQWQKRCFSTCKFEQGQITTVPRVSQVSGTRPH